MSRIYQVLSGAGLLLGLWLLWALLSAGAAPPGIPPQRFRLANGALIALYALVALWLGLGLLWPRARRTGPVMRAITGRAAGLARRLHLFGPLLFSPLPLALLTLQTRPDLFSLAPALAGLVLCVMGVVVSSAVSTEEMGQAWQTPVGRLTASKRIGHAISARFREAAREDWIHWAAVALVLVASIAPRAANLGNVMLYDESMTYLYYAQDPWTALTAYDRPNNHFLHTLLVYLSTQALGGSEAAIRLPAFLASILGLWAVYLLGARLFHRDVGLWALALAGLSPWLMQYSYNARGYTLVVCLTTLALAWLVSTTRAGGSLVAVEVALVLAIYTIPTTAYFYAALLVFVVSLWLSRRFLQRGPDPAPLARVLLAVAAWTVLLYLNPFYWRWLHGYSLYPSGEVWLNSLSEFARFFGGNLFALSSGAIPAPVGVVVIAVVFGMAVAWLWRRRPVSLVLVLCVLLVPLGLVVVQGLMGMDIPPPRVLMFQAPVIYVLAAAGIYAILQEIVRRLRRVGLRWKSPLPGLFPVLVALLIFVLAAPQYARQFTPYDQRADYQDEGHEVREIARYLAGAVEPGDAIFVEACCISAQVQYYLPAEVLAAHWGLDDGTERVFFVPGVWVTLDVFQQRYGAEFQPLGPVADIGRDTVYLFERRSAP